MAVQNISTTLILALCIKHISSTLNHLNIENTIASPISGAEEMFNTFTSTPNILSTELIPEVPEADNHLKCFEKEINKILGAPEYMYYDMEGTGPQIFDNIQSNLLFPEKEKESFTVSEREIQEHQPVISPLDTFERCFGSHQEAQSTEETHTGGIRDKEHKLVKGSVQFHQDKTKKHILESSEQPYQTLEAENLKKKQCITRFEEHDSQWNHDMSFESGIYSHYMLKNNYQIEERKLLPELQWQAKLAMWHLPGISTAVRSFFHSIEDRFVANLAEGWKEYITTEKLLFTFKRIRCELVMGFFGALKVVYRKMGPTEMRWLVEDSWKFLSQYLKKEFEILEYNSQPEPSLIPRSSYCKDKKPGDILLHMLILSNRTLMSSRIIFQLLVEWYQSSKKNDTIFRISMNYPTFVQTCDVLCKRKGEDASIWKFMGDGKTEYARKKGKRIKLDSEKTEKVKGERGYEVFSRGMRARGNNLAESDIPILGQEIKGYFAALMSEVNKMCETQDGLPTGIMGNFDTITQAISVAERYITPMFMGVLISLPRETNDNGYLYQQLIQSGWNLLKTYFYRWLKFLSTIQYSGISLTSKCRAENVNWSDEKMTISHLAAIKKAYQMSPQIIWYLLDLWYDYITTSKQSEVQELSQTILPPNRKYLRESYSANLIPQKKD
ncbi:hypothetical protein DFH28DRAFT_922838 [Melampsora americana]|nr:hypothetical protein DFH28DRAFT_922838 [Melampsora americana]